LGYVSKDRKITVNDDEAERVRTIFRGYLKLGSLNLLMADLRKQGIVTKARTLKSGKTVGGIPFARGPLAHLLRDGFYVGEVAFKGEILKGEQPAILDRDLFDAMQTKLSEQATNHKATRMKSDALLAGRIFDDRGNRMSPTYARKKGIKYRYYLYMRPCDGRASREPVRARSALELRWQKAKERYATRIGRKGRCLHVRRACASSNLAYRTGKRDSDNTMEFIPRAT
jgi:site-specific DNA recombinase